MSKLTVEHALVVRFSDTDAMGVVWHGNYLKFFEDGREAFGEKFNFRYLDMYNSGYFTPIVKSNIEHKAPIFYGDPVKVVATLLISRAAKLVFEYQIVNTETNVVCATGSTTQVFLNAKSRTLEFFAPPFYEAWKKQYVNP